MSAEQENAQQNATETAVLKEQCTNQGESTYRRLYHRTVLRCGELERQVERFSKLFEKLTELERLNEVSLDSLAENHSLLEEQRREMLADQQQWITKLKDSETREERLRKDHYTLTASHEELEREVEVLRAHSGRLLAGLAVSQATHRIQSKQRVVTEATLRERNEKIAKLKRKLASYNRAIQRVKDLRESLEFAEAERATLSEYNSELEHQIVQLRADQQAMIHQSEELKLVKTTLGETCTTFNKLLRDDKSRTTTTTINSDLNASKADGGPDTASLLAHLKALTHKIEDSLTSNKATTPPPSQTDAFESPRELKKSSECPDSHCTHCTQLQEQLSTALRALNGRGCAKYGDLLRENFSLRQDVATARRELGYGEGQFETLTAYLHEYQTNSTKKIDVLKENLSKADREIAELDKVVEQTRQVMHANLAHVKFCPQLLVLLKELDGSEAPQYY